MSGVRTVGEQSEQTISRPSSAAREAGARPSAARFDERSAGNRPAALIARRDVAPGAHTTDAAPRHGGGATREVARQQTLAELKTLVQAIEAGVTDPWQLTDLIFYARHPEMIGVPLAGEHAALLDEWNDVSALLVHPTLNEVGDYLGADVTNGELRGAAELGAAFERVAASRHETGRAERRSVSGEGGGAVSGGPGTRRALDDVIARAVEWCPGLSPSILKGLLAQESGLNPQVINKYGYAGIAQFGREAAREVGLTVGVAGSRADERLDPQKAVPAAARLLRLKAQRLSDMAFSRYGQPTGAEFWKFVLAAYNGGEGTVAVAMGHAYRQGLAAARAKKLVGAEAVSYARNHASKWENLKAGGQASPLGQAAARYFPSLAAAKYHEIGNYPTAIVGRATKARG